jgi:hypothetical protein
MQDLAARFQTEMINIYVKAKEDCRYNATRFLQMVTDSGGVATARTLLRTPTLSDGFAALWEHGRLDLTVEALVLREPWSELFDKEELNIARERLQDAGYSQSG